MEPTPHMPDFSICFPQGGILDATGQRGHVGPIIGDMVMASREKQTLGWNTPCGHWLAVCAGHVRAIFSKKIVQGFGVGPCFLPICCDHSQKDLEAWAAPAKAQPWR